MAKYILFIIEVGEEDDRSRHRATMEEGRHDNIFEAGAEALALVRPGYEGSRMRIIEVRRDVTQEEHDALWAEESSTSNSTSSDGEGSASEAGEGTGYDGSVSDSYSEGNTSNYTSSDGSSLASDTETAVTPAVVGTEALLTGAGSGFDSSN